MAVSQDIGEVRKTAEPVVAGRRLKNNISTGIEYLHLKVRGFGPDAVAILAFAYRPSHGTLLTSEIMWSVTRQRIYDISITNQSFAKAQKAKRAKLGGERESATTSLDRRPRNRQAPHGRVRVSGAGNPVFSKARNARPTHL